MSDILHINHLSHNYGEGLVFQDVSLHLRPQQLLTILGESGCGKSVTALSLMRLVPDPPGKILGGEILLEGKDLLKLSEEEMEKVRGKEIGMIFQEPMTSLNPVLTIKAQMNEILKRHYKMSDDEATEKSIELLTAVGIPNPSDRMNELVGGQYGNMMMG